MKLRTKVFSAWIILSLIVLACTISSGGGLSDNERLQTAVAQTVTANQSQQQQQGQQSEQPLPKGQADLATEKSIPDFAGDALFSYGRIRD